MNRSSSYIMERFGISKEDFTKCVCISRVMTVYDGVVFPSYSRKFVIDEIYIFFRVGSSEGMAYYVYDLEYYFLRRLSGEEFNESFCILSEMRQNRIDNLFK